MDVFGHHALSCRQKSGGIHRHNSIVLSIVKHMKAANVSCSVKMLKYPDLKSRFKPLVVESTGGWHPFSFKYLKDIADRMAGMSRLSAVDALSKLFSSASFCLQRHQGSQLARRCLGVF